MRNIKDIKAEIKTVRAEIDTLWARIRELENEAQTVRDSRGYVSVKKASGHWFEPGRDRDPALDRDNF